MSVTKEIRHVRKRCARLGEQTRRKEKATKARSTPAPRDEAKKVEEIALIREAEMGTDLETETDQVEQVRLLSFIRQEELKTAMETEGGERLAIARRQFEDQLNEVRRRKEAEIDHAVAIADASFKRRQKVAIEDLDKKLQIRLTDHIHAARALNQERTQQILEENEAQLQIAIKEAEKALRIATETDIEEKLEEMSLAWAKTRAIRVNEVNKELADQRLKAMRTARAEAEGNLRRELDQIRSESDAQLDRDLRALADEMTIRRETRLVELTENIEKEHFDRIARLREELSADTERQLQVLRKEHMRKSDEQISVLRTTHEQNTDEELTRIRADQRSALDEEKRRIRADQQIELDESVASERGRYEREKSAELKRIVDQHQADIAQRLHEVRLAFIRQDYGDDALHQQIVNDNGLMTKLEVLADRLCRQRSQQRSATSACRACTKLLAYNAELLQKLHDYDELSRVPSETNSISDQST